MNTLSRDAADNKGIQNTMLSSINSLLEIQEIDLRTTQLQEQINKYPQIWNEVKAELQKKTTKLEKAKKAEEQHKTDRRRIEQELRNSSEKLKKYQGQQMMIQSPREAGALETQITNLKKNISKAEEAGLALLDQEKGIREQIQEAQESLNEAKERAVKERERIRTQLAEKQKELDFLKKERIKVADKAEAGSLARYDKVNNRYPGNAIVPVRNGSCTGCYFALLPNKLVEVHQQHEIVLCDNCGRIMSEDETYEPEPDDDDF